MAVWKALTKRPKLRFPRRKRRGAATLDYILILGVILPIMAFLWLVGPRIMDAAYDLVCVMVTWPFM